MTDSSKLKEKIKGIFEQTEKSEVKDKSYALLIQMLEKERYEIEYFIFHGRPEDNFDFKRNKKSEKNSEEEKNEENFRFFSKY